MCKQHVENFKTTLFPLLVDVRKKGSDIQVWIKNEERKLVVFALMFDSVVATPMVSEVAHTLQERK